MHAASLQQAAAMSTSAGTLVVTVAPPVAKDGAQGQCVSRAADAQESAVVRTTASGQVTDQVPSQREHCVIRVLQNMLCLSEHYQIVQTQHA